MKIRVTVGLWCVALLVGQGCARQERAAFHGERGSIHALAFADDGSLFAATKAGLVQYRYGKSPIAFGWNGLLIGRGIDDIWMRDGEVLVADGQKVARWDGSQLVELPLELPRTAQPVSIDSGRWQVPDRPVWPHETVSAFSPLESNRGTHVSAVAGTSEFLIAAWYGDGLWIGEKGTWQRLAGAENDAFQHVRCLAVRGDDLALATYDGDVYWRRDGVWARQPRLGGPQGSIYALSAYKGNLVGSTFEDGISRWDGIQWTQIRSPAVSSDHARQQAVFGGYLYVRLTTGEVDRFDGSVWVKNVFPWLLRGEATCLGVGDGKLLVGQFGGWSEFDGAVWSHFLKVPELQGFVVTALAAKAGKVWIGSQEHGLFCFDLGAGTLTVYDQRHGLGNDWVRSILVDEGGVMVGMFLTGAYALRGDGFVSLTPEISGESTGLVRDPVTRTLFVGSREGLWRVDEGRATRVPVAGCEKLEIQTMLAVPKGLWLGMPHGAAFVPWEVVRR